MSQGSPPHMVWLCLCTSLSSAFKKFCRFLSPSQSCYFEISDLLSKPTLDILVIFLLVGRYCIDIYCFIFNSYSFAKPQPVGVKITKKKQLKMYLHMFNFHLEMRNQSHFARELSWTCRINRVLSQCEFKRVWECCDPICQRLFIKSKSWFLFVSPPNIFDATFAKLLDLKYICIS
jgi:hypothetical protein